MSILDIISMSLRNLFKRKLRTFLTVLGVMIGTSAIIVMISLGLAINENVLDQLSSWGDVRVLTVRDPNANSWGGGMVYISGGSGSSSSSGRASEPPSLDDKAVASFKQIKNVVAASPIVQIYMTAVSGRYVGWLNIKGIEPEAMEEFGYKLSEGEYLKGDNYGIVFGSEVGYDFRNPNDRNWWRNYDWENRTMAVDLMKDRFEMSYEDGFGYNQGNLMNQGNTDSRPKPKPYRLNVNGVLEPQGYETDYYVFMDINEVIKIRRDQQRYQQNEGYRRPSSGSTASNAFDYVMVMCSDIDSVESIRDEIVSMGFYVDSWFIDYIKSMQEISRSLQLFLGAIGAVSLFVAAIGIANTMIMAIYERTKEIGIMKVIGAAIKDIKRLFLLEAMLIGFIGGAIGIGISLGISYLLNTFGGAIAGGMLGMGMGGKLSVIPLWLCGVALGFAALIGLVSGYFPARRAMNLSALAAIRTE